ncbi:MAG: fatty acid desaturase family protein [Scytonematopsis contorta HA4267-MV1]|jgi:fatty acid desaturase|nr:fatty acid desaturase family protein [Scytonematopsis contorta HA4267-MV1]
MNIQTYTDSKKYRYKIYKFDPSIQKEIKSLAKLDNWHGILALLEDYLVIILSIFITCHFSWYFYPLAVLIIGARQRALATLLHEAAHGTLVKNKYLNFVIGGLSSGYLIFQNFTGYQKTHVYLHHRYLGHSYLDPDYNFHISQGLYNDISSREFLNKYVISPLLLTKVPHYLYALIKDRLFVKGANSLEQAVMLLYLLSIFLTFRFLHQEQIIILFWLVPYLTTFQIIGWFIELSEHYPLVQRFDTDLYMTRNRNSHWLESFFLGIHNENYHLDHHLNPSTPFWNLPKVHKIRLRDSNYAKAHESAGGIFISSNDAQPILRSILM